MPQYLVNEVFRSIQGEGSMQGRPCLFIRFQGCGVNCPFCDTKYARDCLKENQLPDESEDVFKKNANPGYAAFSLKTLLRYSLLHTQEEDLCVLTGGEPCLQPIYDLTEALIREKREVAIETSGCAEICVHPETFVTLSPKNTFISASNWQRANEIKLIVQNRKDVDRFSKELASVPRRKICLQPMSCSQEALMLCLELCQEKNWRLSVQLHKYLNIP